MEPATGYTDILGAHAGNPSDPRASGFPLSIGDVDYIVSSCELGIKAQFEQWVRKGARSAAQDAEQGGDHYEAERLRSLYTKEFALGWYAWSANGVKITAARQTGTGYFYLLYLLLRRCHPQISREDVERLVEADSTQCREALEWSLGNSPSPLRQAGTKQPATLDSP